MLAGFSMAGFGRYLERSMAGQENNTRERSVLDELDVVVFCMLTQYFADMWIFDRDDPDPDAPKCVETYHTFALWPIRLGGGDTMALFNTVTETTISHMKERRNNVLFQISERTTMARSRQEYITGLEEVLDSPECAFDAPYAICYLADVSTAVFEEIEQLENAKPLDPMPPHNAELTFKLRLAGAVGVGEASKTVPNDVNIGMPKRLFRKRHFDKNPRGMLSSPSIASSSMSGGRNSSVRSFQQAEFLAPITENETDGAKSWPFKRACLTGEIIHVPNATAFTNGFQIRVWDELPRGAVVIPLVEPGKKICLGVIVLGLNRRRPFNELYQGWIEAARCQWTNALSSVASFEEEERRREKDRQLAFAQASFLRNASHELKSPLTLLVGPLSDLAEIVTDGHARTLAQTAYRNCERLQRLVESLLSYSRIQSGGTQPRMRRAPIAALTSDLAQLFSSHPRVTSKKVSLSIQCDPDPDPIDTWIDVDFYEKVCDKI